MEENSKKILVGVIIVAVIGLGAGLLYWYYRAPSGAPSALEERGAEKPPSPFASAGPEAGKEGTKEGLPLPGGPSVPGAPAVPGGPSAAGTPAVPGAPAPPEGAPGPAEPAVSLPELNQSDDFARKEMKSLSPNAKFSDWLKIENIIRVITASVDNISRGVSPRPHLGFLSPGKAFSVNLNKGKIYLDPRSYQRYDLLADVFASMDAGKIIKTYREMKPLFQKAYRELGYPDRDFQDTLVQAVLRLLSTPVVKRDILLTESGKGINYLIADDTLEGLSNAQKHLLRMGPENTRKIQKKLREMALALGVPEDKLPRVQVYIPSAE